MERSKANAYHALVRIDRTTGRTAGTVRDRLTMDEAHALRLTLVSAPGYDESTTGYRTVTMPLAAQAAALAVDVEGEEAADLLTLTALHGLWSRGTSRDSLAYAEMTAAALDWLTASHLRETDDSEATRIAVGYAHSRCLEAGLLDWDEFVPASASAMLDAVQDALWTRMREARTHLDTPSTLHGRGDSTGVDLSAVVVTATERSMAGAN